MPSESSPEFLCIAPNKKFSIDYTPNWVRGKPNSYVDNVTFAKVLTDKKYKYRVAVDGKDLGVREAYSVNADGSQKVNLLEYNSGYGVADTKQIQIYAVDPDNGKEVLAAQWK